MCCHCGDLACQKSTAAALMLKLKLMANYNFVIQYHYYVQSLSSPVQIFPDMQHQVYLFSRPRLTLILSGEMGKYDLGERVMIEKKSWLQNFPNHFENLSCNTSVILNCKSIDS